MPLMNNRGFIGVSSRNSERYVKDFEIDTIKVANLNPNFYRHETDEAAANAEAAAQRGASQEPEVEFASIEPEEVRYTDDFENFDIIEDYEIEQEDLDDYLENHLGNIGENDSDAEALYKMNEHLNHILVPLQSFVDNERAM